MRIDIVTLFPEFFDGPLSTGLVGKALAAGRAEVGYVDPRTYSQDRHRTVDDAPYGGGAGMVMKPEPMGAAIAAAKAQGGGPVLLMSPQGRRVTQSDLQTWSKLDHLVMVAGRYEGYDERIRALVDVEVSLGDFVLTGGEYAALVLTDGVIRLLEGTLGNQQSSETDSFSDGLLEHPHYTRPASFEDQPVPKILLSGDHAKIEQWRRSQAVLRTHQRRPDLLESVGLTPCDRETLWARDKETPGFGLAVQCAPEAGALADLIDLAHSYGLQQVWAVAGPGEYEALRAALDELPAWSYPVPAIPPKKRRGYVPPVATREPSASVKVVPSFDVLSGDPDLALVAAGAHLAEPARVMGAQALSEPRADRRTWVLALGANLVGIRGDLPANFVGALPPLRVATRGCGLRLLQAAAIHVDRVIAER